MSAMHRLRVYHALLALLAVLAFLSPEWGSVHSWLGYGVGLVILARLVMALTGAPQLGLMRFYPHFQSLKLGTVFTHPAISGVLLLGIAICLVGVTGTGIALDKGRAFGLGRTEARLQVRPAEPEVPIVRGEDHERRGGSDDEREDDRDDGEGGEAVEEVHEFLGNLLMFLVGGHVAYLLIFKRPLARFMLFMTPARPKAAE